MQVKRGFGDAGFPDDLVDPGRAIAVAVKQLTGGGKNPVTRPALGVRYSHAVNLY